MHLRRETPLKKCPRPTCRRAGTCLDRLPEFYCSKIFMTPDERRMQLAAKLGVIAPGTQPVEIGDKDETWKAILLAELQAAHAWHRGSSASQQKHIKRAERIRQEWRKKQAAQLAANSQTP